MPADSIPSVRNGEAFAAAAPLSLERFRREVLDSVASGGRIAAFFARRETDEGERSSPAVLTAVTASDAESSLRVFSTTAEGTYPSLTPECAQLHWFEREVFEQQGLVPAGHPWLKPIRFTAPAQRDAARVHPVAAACGVTDFFQMAGEEVHEVAVGPVHAGIIEPGHFRFQCHGETVYHLEISLGYQHRGVERGLLGGPNPRTIHYIETLAGDTTAGHTLAYCWAVEALSRTRVPPRAQALRGIALELERLANHIGDLGALAGDVGFLPTMSYCGRIRGDVLNLTAMLCGNRFARGLIRPGGVAFDLDTETVAEMKRRLAAVAEDARVAIELLWRHRGHHARWLPTDGLGRSRCAGLRRRTRRAAGFSRRDLSLRSHSRIDVPFRRRVCAGLRTVAGDSTLVDFRRGATGVSSGGSDPDNPSAAAAGPYGGLADRRLAGRNLSRGDDGRAGPVCRLQSGRPVVPQLVRIGLGTAEPADFRFSAVQQEL
jgi:hypothetical protein